MRQMCLIFFIWKDCKGMEQIQRLIELNKIARTQLKSLLNNKNIKTLKGLNIKQIGSDK